MALFFNMSVEFDTALIVYICEFMTCCTSYCPYVVKRTALWNILYVFRIYSLYSSATV